jgi:hypothetical protein
MDKTNTLRQQKHQLKLKAGLDHFNAVWAVFKAHAKEINKLVNADERHALAKVWNEVEPQ